MSKNNGAVDEDQSLEESSGDKQVLVKVSEMPEGVSSEPAPILDLAKNADAGLLYWSLHYFGAVSWLWEEAKKLEREQLKVVEFGAGYGDFYACLQGHKFWRIGKKVEYVGFDIDHRKRNKLKKLFPKVDYRLVNLATDDINEPCDFAICMEVYEHLIAEDGDRLLASIFRSLKPGGKVFLTVPTPNLKRPNKWHLNEVEPDVMIKALKKSGLETTGHYPWRCNMKEIERALPLAASDVFLKMKDHSFLPTEVLRFVFSAICPTNTKSTDFVYIAKKSGDLK